MDRRQHRQHREACCGSRRSPTEPPRFGPRWPTASTTTSSTAPRSTTWSAAIADLTGKGADDAPWAYGFWQCREHYKTAQEITDVLKGYRDRKAPIDNIVQDWQYWKESMGLAPVRSIPLPGSGGDGSRPSTHVQRPGDDLGVAEVLHHHPTTPRLNAQGLRLHSPTSPREEGLRRLQLHLLRRLQGRRARHVLVANEHGAFLEGHRCLVDGRHRARDRRGTVHQHRLAGRRPTRRT
jgi:hypothetical protein